MAGCEQVSAELTGVLVVDDEVDMLEFAARALRSRYQVRTCGVPGDAEMLLRTGDFAVLVTDHRMPGMDGLDLVRVVDGTHPDLARVLLTGFADSDDVAAARAAGLIDVCVHKPIDGGQLVAAIEEAIRRRGAR